MILRFPYQLLQLLFIPLLILFIRFHHPILYKVSFNNIIRLIQSLLSERPQELYEIFGILVVCADFVGDLFAVEDYVMRHKLIYLHLRACIRLKFLSYQLFESLSIIFLLFILPFGLYHVIYQIKTRVKLNKLVDCIELLKWFQQ